MHSPSRPPISARHTDHHSHECSPRAIGVADEEPARRSNPHDDPQCGARMRRGLEGRAAAAASVPVCMLLVVVVLLPLLQPRERTRCVGELPGPGRAVVLRSR